MLFQSRQVKGQGRGHQVGFPTINLIIPDDLVLDEGIYATWVVIDGNTYKGALHYGPVPTFGLKENTMEVHLIDVNDDTAPATEDKEIEIDVVEKLRDIKKFEDTESLVIQIADDVEKTKRILK